jgi:citrate lyase subunit beta/citryl-CoA lyase
VPTPSLRSFLFVPGTHPGRFQRALDSGADAVVFDLEDAVDATRKDEARRLVAEFLSVSSAHGAMRLVRVNAAATDWLTRDLAMIAATANVDGIVVPKAADAAGVERVSESCGGRPVFPLLETAKGILHAEAVASARATIPALLFGAEDLTAAIGVARTIDGEELLYARSRVVLAATAAEADAIDAVFTAIGDESGLRRDAGRARALGFRGKMAIHPAQIPIIHDAFSPSPEEVAQARRIVAAFDRAQASGEGVIRLDDAMVDAPVVARAREVLARNRP